MSKEPTTTEKLRSLRWDILHSVANSVYCQLTLFGTVFVLFLSELGMSKTQIGWVLSMFPFASVLSLFIAPLVAGFGYKRTFMTFWGARKFVTALLLLTPWVLSAYGSQGAILFVVVVIALFTICRSIAMTGRQPWQLEVIPDSVRGKYSARKMFFSRIASFFAVTAAGYILGQAPDLNRFMLLFAIGVPIGLSGLWAVSRVPGGAPERKQESGQSYRHMVEALKDRRFARFVLGSSMITLTLGPLTSFVPLFMQEQVGLSSGRTVLLQTGTMIGALLSSYLWGWAADRYGSNPIMLSGVYLQILLPIAWLLMPRHTAWSLYIALAVALLQGVASMGWKIGSARLLYVSLVPSKKKAGYMSLRYAWLGVVGGLSKLFSGRLIDFTQGLSGQFLMVTLDPYTFFFIASLIFPLLSIFLLRRVRADSQVSTGEFAGMFVQGKPLRAFASLVKFHRARNEEETVSTTEGLGQTHSPLAVEELLEALDDPRFYVRFEAIVSIARTSPNERLITALADVLHGDNPALSVIAAWALGRMGQSEAIPALRGGLNARYRSVQAHSARSLGSIGDEESVPVLLDRLEDEEDRGLRLAYASALGKLEADEATWQLLSALGEIEDSDGRAEIALALARITGDEHQFVHLLRQARTDPGTTMAQTLISLRRLARRRHTKGDRELLPLIDQCAEAFARDELDHGVALLRQLVVSLPVEESDGSVGEVLHGCVGQLEKLGSARIEYVILTLHALEAWFSRRPANVLMQVLPEDLDLV